MNKLTLLLFSLLLCTTICAQTSLGPGDVMLTLVNTDNTDAFAFVLLKDVTAGTSFRVTKGEYKSGVLQTSDGTTEITFTSPSSCGAEFLFTSQLSGNGSSTGFYNPTSLNGGGSVSSALVEGTSMTLASSGDGLIAFQGATYITILQKCGGDFGDLDSQCSDLPPGLTAGLNALAYRNGLAGNLSEPDNIKYDCSPTSGTSSQLATALATNSNWLENNDTPFSYGSGCGFACQAACTDPVLTSIMASDDTPCAGVPFNISINGNLNDASEWSLREGGCTGPVIAQTTGNTFTNVSVTSTTSFSVTALNCNSSTLCLGLTVTPPVPSATAGSDQLGVNSYPVQIFGNAPGAGSGMWTVTEGDGNGAVSNPTQRSTTFSGTPGVAYTLRWTLSGGGCPATFDEVMVSANSGNSTLAAGDILFTMINTDDDGFAFVVLADEILAGTSFFVTDREYRNGALNGDEGVVQITFLSDASCGMEFTALSPASNGVYVGTEVNNEALIEITATEGSMLLNSGGDGLIAYQDAANRTFLTALQKCGFGFGNADSQCSDLPAGLTEGVNALAYTNNLSGDLAEPDNIKYDCSVNSGQPAALRTALTANVNWLEDNITAFDYGNGCNFDCQDCVTPVISSLGLNPSQVCPDQPTTITVNGSLNGASRWVVYAPGDCGGTELASSISNTITFTPNGSGNYLVAGVDGCVATPICNNVIITQTGAPADITMDQPTTKLFDTSVALTAEPLGAGQTGTWSIVSGSDNNGVITNPSGPNATLTGPEGSGYQLRYTVTGNGCPVTTDEVYVSFMVDIGLMAGDMIFTGYNSQSADNFSVVVLNDLTPGTAFSVTDNGWLAAGGFRAGENTANYFLCRPLSCGDNIRFEQDGNGYAPDGTVIAELQNGSSFPSLSTSGDQLFLYGGFTPPSAGNETRFVSAIQMNCENGACSEANWDGDATDNGSSAKPAFFTSNNSIFGGTAPPNNARYDCANGTSNTLDLFALISTDANWSFQDAVFTLDGCGFTCDPAPMAICQDITVEIDADGNPTTNGQAFMASDLDGGSTDNGSIDPNGFSVDITPGCGDVTTPPSATTITLTVTDNLGQTATCTAQVTVEDNIAPTGTCQNVAVNLDANGNVALNAASLTFNEVLTSFSDNCAPSAVSAGVTATTVGCERLGTTSVTYFYRDRPLSATSREFSCTVQIQINDPLGVCGSDPVASCQPFAAGPDENGNYTLDANSLDNGSTDDRSVYSLVFSDETSTIGQTADNGGNNNSIGHGQSFTASQTGAIQKIKVRFAEARSNATLHFYNSATGSGVIGGVGTSGCCTFGDLVFEIDFISPTTQDFSGDDEYPVTVYAVDDQGNLSAACNSIFTLDQSLPVEWLSFGANAGAKAVDLQWETTEEPDNAGFHIEQSATGNDWSVIGEVPARTGADQRYNFEDSTPLEGTGYYRLRQTDFDGQVTYSPVETVEFYANDRVSIYPNPATNEFIVQLPDGAELLGLLDLAGRTTKVRFNGENGQLRTNVSSLPAGVYLLRVRLVDGRLNARRLMVR